MDNTVLLINAVGRNEELLFSERPLSYSDESRLSNLLRRITREDDRDRRLATVKQLKEFIQQPENKLVSNSSFSIALSISCFIKLSFSNLSIGICLRDYLVYKEFHSTRKESVFLDCLSCFHNSGNVLLGCIALN